MRPLVPADERVEMLGALRAVDGVFLVHGPPSLRGREEYAGLLAPLNPARLAWTRGDPFGEVKRQASRMIGADGVEIAEVPDHSTTSLVRRATSGPSSSTG